MFFEMLFAQYCILTIIAVFDLNEDDFTKLNGNSQQIHRIKLDADTGTSFPHFLLIIFSISCFCCLSLIFIFFYYYLITSHR